MAKNFQIKTDSALSYVSSFNVNSDQLFLATRISDDELERLFSKNWMVRRICEGFAKDMTAKGVSWKTDAETAKSLEDAFRHFRVWRVLTDAITFARLFGTSVVVLDMADQAYNEPLNESGSLIGLRVFDKTEISLGQTIIEKGLDAGTPLFYNISPRLGNTEQFKVHHSRVIRFDGARSTHTRMSCNQNFGESVIESAHRAISDYGMSIDSALELLKRCYLRFLGLQNFWQGLSDDRSSSFIGQAAGMINEVQNISGLTIADKDDNFQTHSYSFSGIRDVLITFSEQVAGATGYPIVKLFGMSPSGFSTGEADLANYYDSLASEQEDQLRDPIGKIAKILTVNNSAVDFDFVPNRETSTSEKIATAQTAVNTILQVHEAGLITDKRALEEISALSEKVGIFSTVTTEDIDKLEEISPPTIDELNLNANAVI